MNGLLSTLPNSETVLQNNDCSELNRMISKPSTVELVQHAEEKSSSIRDSGQEVAVGQRYCCSSSFLHFHCVATGTAASANR